MKTPILKVEHLCKSFPIGRRTLRAVEDVSLSVLPGETLGLVGESGCGKTTLGRTIIRIEEPTGGRILFKGNDITHVPNRKLKTLRKSIQMVFQDPYESLDPRSSVGGILEEPMQIHKMYTPQAREERVQELLETVGLKPDHIRRYAHEFSGGQRQRIGIARALALNPELIICDEALSALDVSIQAQIINLLVRIQETMGIAYLFIAHDLAVVRHLSHSVAVMYRGRIVEYGPTEEVYGSPAHPYTKALLSAALTMDPRRERGRARERIMLEGEIAAPIDIAEECPFVSRCKERCIVCGQAAPPLVQMGSRSVACHLVKRG